MILKTKELLIGEKEKKEKSPKEYLAYLEEKRITPNWWCSEEYFLRAGFKVFEEAGVWEVKDLFGGIIFPVLNNTGVEFWADFPEAQGNSFLDFEYIYDPKEFLEMRGGSWQVFRKNSRKFPRRHGEDFFCYVPIEDKHQARLFSLLNSWTSKFEEIHDAEVLIDFCLRGEHREVLVDKLDGQVYGLNVWDENYCYVNFRYSICESIPYLAEYLRLLFYQGIVGKHKLVNDGGSFGELSLIAFKNKMNPVKVREVKSKRRMG